MRSRHLITDVWISVILLAVTASPVRAADETQQGAPDDPDKIVVGLRQVTNELNDSVKQFQTHLDREIALHDRGYRTQNGHRIPGADADLLSGPADLTLPTVQKLLTARMISARRPGYQPLPLADSDRIQSLIAEARDRVAMGNSAMRQLLMISAKDLNTRSDAEKRAQRSELLKARNAATEAARRALVVLPIDLPEAESPEDQMDRNLSLTPTALPIGKNDGTLTGSPAQKKEAEDVVLPIRPEQKKKVTLIHELFRRVTLTDSGIEDGQGRRLFYQEDWEQRQGMTAVKRWAVAVNTATGQHTMLRRYAAREFPGDLEEVYQSHGREYASRSELPENSLPPSLQEITSETVETARSREDLHDAVLNFKAQIREALARNDALIAGQNKLALDDELPDTLRETLFAIRSHLARTTAILDGEGRVRRAVERSIGRAGTLEALSAWANGSALERESPAGDSRALLEALSRSDAEIDLTQSVKQEAIAALPPDVSRPEEQFPALRKDFILRMRGVSSTAEHGGAVRCRQEIWRIEGSASGGRRVKRTIFFIDIESSTGNQIPAGREVRYYPVGADDTLESIYDENAAQAPSPPTL
jgi:hypothetical protein